MKTAKPKTCTYCGTEFEAKRFLQQFCKPACQIAHTKETTKEWPKRPVKAVSPPKEHPTFVKNREALKQQLKDECGVVYCQRCYNQNMVPETHHIIYRSEKPQHEFLHDIRNLICLCHLCHEWAHSKKSNRDTWIVERNLTELFGNSILSKKL